MRLIKKVCDFILGEQDEDGVELSGDDCDESIVDKAIRNCDQTRCVNSGLSGFSVDR